MLKIFATAWWRLHPHFHKLTEIWFSFSTLSPFYLPCILSLHIPYMYKVRNTFIVKFRRFFLIVFFNSKFIYNEKIGFKSFMHIFFYIFFISTHNCASGIFCMYQIQINWMKTSKHSPLPPKAKGMFLSSCMSQLRVVPLTAYPSCTVVFLPSEARKRFRLHSMCWRPVGLSGKTQKSNSKEWDTAKEAPANSFPSFSSLMVSVKWREKDVVS